MNDVDIDKLEEQYETCSKCGHEMWYYVSCPHCGGEGGHYPAEIDPIPAGPAPGAPSDRNRSGSAQQLALLGAR